MTSKDELLASQIKTHLADRWWRLNNLYYIKNKQGDKVLLRLNWAQKKLYYDMWYFNVILKARQLGFTTFSLIYFLDACLFGQNHAAGVIADTRENAEDLFTNKVKFAYDNLPSWLKGHLTASVDSARQMVFNNGSSFTVGTSLRSGTYQKVLISEYGKISAKFPDKAREIKTGALNTVEAGQQIFVESTAEGKMGEFFELVEQARRYADQKKKLTRLEPKFHFFAWFDNPEYRLNQEETALTIISKETAQYLGKLLVDPQQQAWYAAKEQTQGEDMKREFPSTADEAFEGSMEGAIYAKEMAKIRQRNQITNVQYDSRYPVNTFWDIGQASDQMSILAHQYINRQHLFINYHESNNEGWDFYAKVLKDWGYVYNKHYWPHDGKKRILGNVILTSQELAERVGIRPITITPVTKSVWDDIRNNCKPLLPQCIFDQVNCATIIKRLDNYRKRWDDTNSMWLNDPAHDENSHGADSFRTFAMNADDLDFVSVKEAPSIPPSSLEGWMAM